MRLAFYSLTRGALSLAAKERCVAARSLGVQPFSRTMSMAAGARLAEENRSSPKHRLPADYDSVFCLRRERIDFSFGGNKFHLDSVIQDTQPEGSDVGTVIAMHGSPGSHKDFKYVTPLLQKAGIRFIGINFPGYGYSQADERLIQDNTERVAYVQAVIDHLGLERNLIFMGHSRGTENALKMAALNADKTVGLVNANFIGIRTHRGIKPTWVLDTLDFLWHLGWTRWFMRPILFYVYNNIINLRVPNADVAAWSLSAMVPWKVDLPGQEVFVDKLNRSGVRSLLLYAGKDPLVESEISSEFAELFEGHVHFESEATKTDDKIVRHQAIEALEAGNQSVAVHFKNADHFLQKHQALLIADWIITLFAKEQ